MIENNVEAPLKLKNYKNIKRVIDILISLSCLMALAIPFILIALAIKIDSQGPVFFRQLRVGKGGASFICYKFRSMYITAPQNCSASQLSNRQLMVTHIGRFLRKTSLDELPQLYNVLRGDMSLIGPRPLILEEKWIHNERMKFGIYALQPGITGLAQICGRNNISDSEKLYFDKYYLTNFSLWLDIKIMFGTLLYVLQQKDIL